MEDIVAVAVKLSSGQEVFFLTWGRIQDTVNPKPLAQLILEQSQRFSLGEPALSARVCSSLHEAAQQPLFYEGFFSFCQKHVPYGPEYTVWRQEILELMQQGKELYFLGNPQRYGLPSVKPDATQKGAKSRTHAQQ